MFNCMFSVFFAARVVGSSLAISCCFISFSVNVVIHELTFSWHFDAGISSGVIAGVSVAGVSGALVLVLCAYAGIYRRQKMVETSFLPEGTEDRYIQHKSGNSLGLVLVG